MWWAGTPWPGTCLPLGPVSAVWLSPPWPSKAGMATPFTEGHRPGSPQAIMGGLWGPPKCSSWSQRLT